MIKILPRLLQLGLLMVTASAFSVQAQPTPSAAGQYVYRVDGKPILEAFADGIYGAPQGTNPNYDILRPALGLGCGPGQRSPWISTSTSLAATNRFLNSIAATFEPRPDGTRPFMDVWVYTIQTDDSYLDVEEVIADVIEAGQRNQFGYTPSHAQTLQRLLASTPIGIRGEVFTTHIAAQRIRHANRVRITPGSDPLWGQTAMNSAFRHDTSTGSNPLPPLAQTVPPDSPGFGTTVAVQPANGTCFQSCDGASGDQRMKRSADQSEQLPAYCAAQATRPQAFMGAED